MPAFRGPPLGSTRKEGRVMSPGQWRLLLERLQTRFDSVAGQYPGFGCVIFHYDPSERHRRDGSVVRAITEQLNLFDVAATDYGKAERGGERTSGGPNARPGSSTAGSTTSFPHPPMQSPSFWLSRRGRARRRRVTSRTCRRAWLLLASLTTAKRRAGFSSATVTTLPNTANMSSNSPVPCAPTVSMPRLTSIMFVRRRAGRIGARSNCGRRIPISS